MLTVAVLLLVFSTVGFAQSAGPILEPGVKAHAEIDTIYKKFSDGYRTLTPKTVADLYTDDAAYLAPNQEVTNGRDAILENFTGFFANIKERGQTMTISFRILQRKVDKSMAYDVGIYTIDFLKDGARVGESKGKFVVVAVKDTGDKWRLQVDGYSALNPQD